MGTYVTGDKHTLLLDAFSYNANPELRRLTEDDVVVICGDVGLGWTGADREYKYVLDFLATKPFKIVAVRGNHDNTDVIRNHSVAATGDRSNIKLVSGTLSNPVYGDKIYSNFYWVSDAAILNLNGHRSLLISGASSHDIQHLVSPHEKNRIKRLRQCNKFYRVIGKTWWPDENINIPYVHSLLNEYLRIHDNHFVSLNSAFHDKRRLRYGNFDYIFTHDCPAFMCDVYARPGDLGRLRPTENEDFLELIKDHINYRYFIHGHMHTFGRYAVTEDDYGKHEVVCLYKDIFKLPDNPRDSNLQDWEFVCQTAQIV